MVSVYRVRFSARLACFMAENFWTSSGRRCVFLVDPRVFLLSSSRMTFFNPCTTTAKMTPHEFHVINILKGRCSSQGVLPLQKLPHTNSKYISPPKCRRNFKGVDARRTSGQAELTQCVHHLCYPRCMLSILITRRFN